MPVFTFQITVSSAADENIEDGPVDNAADNDDANYADGTIVKLKVEPVYFSTPQANEYIDDPLNTNFPIMY